MNKQILNKYEETFDKTKYLVGTRNENIDDYHKRCMKISFNSNEGLQSEKH